METGGMESKQSSRQCSRRQTLLLVLGWAVFGARMRLVVSLCGAYLSSVRLRISPAKRFAIAMPPRVRLIELSSMVSRGRYWTKSPNRSLEQGGSRQYRLVDCKRSVELAAAGG